MATHTWIGSNGGAAPWSVAANWSDDTLPVAGDTEVFKQPFGSEVDFSSATETLDAGTIIIAAGGVEFENILSQTTIVGIPGGVSTVFGALSNEGAIDVDPLATLVIGASSFVNDGSITVESSPITADEAQFVSRAADNFNLGAMWIGWDDVLTVYGNFSNDGSIEATAGSTIDISGVSGGLPGSTPSAFSNTGTILMNDATLFLNGDSNFTQAVNSITGSGNSLLLGNLGFGTVVLDGGIQIGPVFNRVEVSEAALSGGSIAFAGAGTLAIDTFTTTPSNVGISSTITGFDANDAFDLTQINAPSLFVTYTTGTLGIWDALGLVGSLNLVGNYTTSDFQLKSDGSTGTDIIFSSPPVVTTDATVVHYVGLNAAKTIDAGLTISDAESTTLTGATVHISTGFLAGDTLSLGTTEAGITSIYDATNGVLSLSGSASVAAYQAALDSVAYAYTTWDPTDGGSDTNRTITWSVNDGTAASNSATSTLGLRPHTPPPRPPSTIETLTNSPNNVFDSASGAVNGDTFVLDGGASSMKVGLTDSTTWNFGYDDTVTVENGSNETIYDRGDFMHVIVGTNSTVSIDANAAGMSNDWGWTLSETGVSAVDLKASAHSDGHGGIMVGVNGSNIDLMNAAYIRAGEITSG